MQAKSVIRWKFILGAWLCIGVLLAAQILWEMLEYDLSPKALAVVTVQQFLRAGYWALLTPLVLAARDRYPLVGPFRYFRLLGHVLAAFVAMMLFWVLRLLVIGLPAGLTLEVFEPAQIFARFHARNFIDMGLYAGILFAAWVKDLWQREQELRSRSLELRARLAESELMALRRQVQPHFLFNALNAVGALVRLDRRTEAVKSIAQLSRLHRALLESAGLPFVPLEREIGFIHDYLDIECLRFGERMRIQVEIDPAAQEAMVPNLILQPLVENAVKHGVARREGESRVRVQATVRNARLRLEIANDPPSDDLPAPDGTGYGLQSTRERLVRIYGNEARLDVDAAAPEGFLVTLEIPLAPPPNQAATHEEDIHAHR